MAKGNTAKKDARSLLRVERQRQILELRKGGASYDQIAKATGLAGRSSARREFQLALQKVIEEPAKEVLALELSRLDSLVLALWQQAKTGNVAAIDRVLKIMERRASYLGLDAPKKTELSGADGGPVSFADVSHEALIAKLDALAKNLPPKNEG